MLREITIKDFEDYFRILRQMNKMEMNITKSQFWDKYNLIKKNGGTIFVYEIDNIIVGTIKIFDEIKFFDNVTHIEDVIIDYNNRRSGIGKKMVLDVIEIVKEKSYKVVLQSKIDFNWFYTSCGFNLEGNSYTIRFKN